MINLASGLILQDMIMLTRSRKKTLGATALTEEQKAALAKQEAELASLDAGAAASAVPAEAEQQATQMEVEAPKETAAPTGGTRRMSGCADEIAEPEQRKALQDLDKRVLGSKPRVTF